MDENLKDQLLRNISTGGAASEDRRVVNLVLGSRNNLSHILDHSAGMPRFRKVIEPRFELIFNQPLSLKGLHPVEIRCCLCREVITYPAWYYVQKFVVNHLHYFVCFDNLSPNRVTPKCYRR